MDIEILLYCPECEWEGTEKEAGKYEGDEGHSYCPDCIQHGVDSSVYEVSKESNNNDRRRT